MALASTSEVEDALGRELADGEDVSTVLETASDLVVGYLGYTPDPVPDPVARVVADMVAAVLSKPAQTTADYQATGYNVLREPSVVRVGVESSTSTGPWLTAALKMRLRPYRNIKTRSVFSINTALRSTAPERNDISDDEPWRGGLL